MKSRHEPLIGVDKERDMRSGCSTLNFVQHHASWHVQLCSSVCRCHRSHFLLRVVQAFCAREDAVLRVHPKAVQAVPLLHG